jgi:hypothetical protein
MPRVFAAKGKQVSLLRTPRPGGDWTQEEMPFVRRAGVQKHSRGRSATGAKEDSENNGLRGLREAGLTCWKPLFLNGLNRAFSFFTGANRAIVSFYERRGDRVPIHGN